MTDHGSYFKVICTDECFLCKIGYEEGDVIEINECVFTLCDDHHRMATKNALAPSNKIEDIPSEHLPNEYLVNIIKEVVELFIFSDGCLDLSGDDLEAFILTLAERIENDL